LKKCNILTQFVETYFFSSTINIYNNVKLTRTFIFDSFLKLHYFYVICPLAHKLCYFYTKKY